jgi:hypothetical protein
MKTKLLTVLVLVVTVALGAVAGGAGARTSKVTVLQADLTLSPGVPRAGHPAAPGGLYGGLDATYNSSRSTLAFNLAYRGLKGYVFRVVVQSNATRRTYAVLCTPCRSVVTRRAGRLTVYGIKGVVKVDPDDGFLITSGRSSIVVLTSAYPTGEISAPVYVPPTPQPGGPPTETPRCC